MRYIADLVFNNYYSRLSNIGIGFKSSNSERRIIHKLTDRFSDFQLFYTYESYFNCGKRETQAHVGNRGHGYTNNCHIYRGYTQIPTLLFFIRSNTCVITKE